jgi:hypothetical protein
MILYSVTVNVDADIHEEWLSWMQRVHIPKVIATGFFVEHKILKLLTEIENNGVTYSVQYFLDNMDNYNTYANEHSPTLQKEHSLRYEGKFVAFRTLLEVLPNA